MKTCVDSVGKSLAITLTKLQLYQYNYIFLGAVAEAQVVKRWHSFQGTVFLVPVVEGDGDGGLGDASLAVLVDQLLQAFSSDL